MNTTRISIEPKDLVMFHKYIIIESNGKEQCAFFNSLYKDDYCCFSNGDNNDFQYIIIPIEGTTFHESSDEIPAEEEQFIQPKKKDESTTLLTPQRPYLQLCGKYIINTNNIFYIKKYENEYEIVFSNGNELLIKKNQDNESFDAMKAFFNEFIENNKVDL
jgi:hypothetical protein